MGKVSFVESNGFSPQPLFSFLPQRWRMRIWKNSTPNLNLST